jgi:hypothetical protein
MTATRKQYEERRRWTKKQHALQLKFARAAGGCLNSSIDIVEHQKGQPSGVHLFMTQEFRAALETTERIVAHFRKAGLR